MLKTKFPRLISISSTLSIILSITLLAYVWSDERLSRVDYKRYDGVYDVVYTKSSLQFSTRMGRIFTDHYYSTESGSIVIIHDFENRIDLPRVEMWYKTEQRKVLVIKVYDNFRAYSPYETKM